MISAKEKALRKRLYEDFEFYAQNALKIRTKEAGIQPFLLNKAQKYIHGRIEEQKKETGRVRVILLKGRQQGASTYTEGRFYWLSSHRKGVRAFILTHDAESTNALFEMARRYHEHCPKQVQPVAGKSNAKELLFTDLDSGYKIGTAGNKSVGRGTTLQYFHGSEVAFWANASEHTKGILQAVPRADDTEVILESTANGVGNFFHQQWLAAERGEGDFIAIFVPWYWQDEYKMEVPEGFEVSEEELQLKKQFGLTDEQLQWRRVKITELAADGADGEKGFQQEYPNTASEAFITSGEDGLITPDLVVRARKAEVVTEGQLVLGVDIARYGSDSSVITWRRGRCVENQQSKKHLDTMACAGWVAQVIEDDKPALVNLDIGAMGAGVYDRLVEMGYGKIVKAVNFGSRAFSPRYSNRRTEMYAKAKQWLEAEDLPVSIPDDDALQGELCATPYKLNSERVLALESKDKIKAQLGVSPDKADSFALTFANPIPMQHSITSYAPEIY